ncbi:MAG: hypothetical protein NXH83_08855 [Rhodobacteraceae bacterium]|nr:hypothetical protein [Paracoccaceae bacterium]
MNSRIFQLSAVAALLGSAALAGPFEDRIVENLQDLGYDYIEVKTGPSQVKAEAVRGTRKLEVVYDRSTGRIISREEERAGAGYLGRTGVEFDTEGEDFVDGVSPVASGSTGVAAAPTGSAGAFESQIVANLQGMGYEYIEIETGPNQVKAEAVRGTRKLELVFDRATGQIIKREEERAGAGYLGRTGVEFDTDDDDFLDDDERDDDDDRDDERDDDERDDDERDDERDDDERDDDERDDDERDDDRDDDDEDDDRDDDRDDDDDDDRDDDRDDDDGDDEDDD